MAINDWQEGKPPVNLIVEVWHLNQFKPAKWDGANWRDLAGNILDNVTHWLYKGE